MILVPFPELGGSGGEQVRRVVMGRVGRHGALFECANIGRSKKGQGSSRQLDAVVRFITGLD